ncbi:MliC family protein [Oecophyllibacter saccharovorans]|uniref:MliC family protein n=1 Tax=Oecophyllibacter saccharovorans TaxID=2558360 RepID=UPI0018C8AC9F|nr:MliC family protein [Oecophyllibacter saccharovorans]
MKHSARLMTVPFLLLGVSLCALASVERASAQTQTSPAAAEPQGAAVPHPSAESGTAPAASPVEEKKAPDVLIIPLSKTAGQEVAGSVPALRETYRCQPVGSPAAQAVKGAGAASGKPSVPQEESEDEQSLNEQLPATGFEVKYYNLDQNSLAVVPLREGPLVFVNVISADGARYVAGPYVWWTRGNEATFYSEALSGPDADGPRLVCKAVTPAAKTPAAP